MATAADNDVSSMSFEAALARLEDIVRTLEKGEAPLDRSIELYQEGDRLKRHCEARLKDAQARIEQIAFGSDGKGIECLGATLAGGEDFIHRGDEWATHLTGRCFYLEDARGKRGEVSNCPLRSRIF